EANDPVLVPSVTVTTAVSAASSSTGPAGVATAEVAKRLGSITVTPWLAGTCAPPTGPTVGGEMPAAATLAATSVTCADTVNCSVGVPAEAVLAAAPRSQLIT